MQLNFILGTAAELIKVYPLIKMALDRSHPVRILSTGQSRENFLMQYRDFNLPDSFLKQLLPSRGDLDRSAAALKWFVRASSLSKKNLEAQLLQGEHSFVVVHGDTLSTLVGAWLSRKSGLPLVHVEAGLRSPHVFNPFPEEINRRLVAKFARFHMAPDGVAVQNLKRSKARGEIINTQGNTLIDALRLVGDTPFSEGQFALANIHRFENLNSPSRWRVICETLVKVSETRKLIFIAHPQTLRKLERDTQTHSALLQAGIDIRPRMPFSKFISLLKSAEFLLSDGGSNQEECSYLGKPCLIMRETTERQEGLEKTCVLSRFDPTIINSFLADPAKHRTSGILDDQSPSARILAALTGQPLPFDRKP